MYVGLMGGSNSGEKAQADSGNFIYHNKGIVWFMDLGGENPANAAYAEESGKYKFYRANAEGQNVVYIAKNEQVAYGQYTAGYGEIVKTFENEHGSYAILNNTDAYPEDIISQALRGVFITNDRKTVVLQDEVFFVHSQAVYWVAHTAQSIYIDPTTERTAYLTAISPDGNSYTLRASIVTPSTELKFSTLSANNQNTLDATSETYQVYDRKNINRLVISAGTAENSGVGSFNVSVVFELVSGTNDTTPVGYEWKSMYEWEPSAMSTEGNTAAAVVNRGPAVLSNIISSTNNAVNILKKNNAYKEKLKSLYEALSLVAYTLKKYPSDNLTSAHLDAYGNYRDCYDKYEKFYNFVNDSVDVANNLSFKFTGITVEAETEE